MSSGRRPTAKPYPELYGHTRTVLPMPTPLAKPTSTRLSLAGPTKRGSMLPPPAPPSSGLRQSVYGQNMNPLLASASKAALGRTPMSQRRGSMWQGVMATPAPPALTARDPRSLRDRPFQAEIRKDIAAWLTETGWTCAPQTLNNITAKDFRIIFQHLILLLDPNYPFDPNVRLEDDFVPALKCIQYPFVNQLDSKWLVTPASMHAWPFLLGVLHWLVEEGKGRLNHVESQHPTLQDPSAVPEEFEDSNSHRALATDYLVNAYDVFLNGSDVFDDQKRALEDRYDLKKRRVVAESAELKGEIKQAKAELKKIQSIPHPIVQLQSDNDNLKRDREKYQDVMRRWESRKKNLIDTIAREKVELEKWNTQLEKLQMEDEELAKIVKEQDLTPEEVIRMNNEYEHLTRSLEDLKVKLAESRKILSTLEVTLANRVASTEEAIDTYNRWLGQLGFFPSLPTPFDGMDLGLSLNPAASSPQGLLRGLNMQDEICPTLSSIAKSKRSERASVVSERDTLNHELDQLAVECENLEVEVATVEKHYLAKEDEAIELRDAAQQELLISSDEASRLEAKIAGARSAARQNGLGVKQHLQAVEIAYREQVEKFAKIRDATARAILKNAKDIAVFKDEVSQQLHYVQEFAETN
ncbi:HEC/Ndc80p family-domain-containing protein [Vararia minispora EC-137]|uniref:HEC/Ndc80p family-domain-containing protein n=1 Tax=Vararia minispora EC-137 TaxID=1314806 RepID=A0ACB8QEU2_9AGAM|nr:HEC/Ndc80p family-domain-containing protein [Vararia minispora EC-137]